MSNKLALTKFLFDLTFYMEKMSTKKKFSRDILKTPCDIICEENKMNIVIYAFFRKMFLKKVRNFLPKPIFSFT